MQVIELAGIILALSMEVLEDVILAQPLKATSQEKMAWPSSHGFVAAKKLHRLAWPTHSGVLAPVEKPKDVDKKVGDQRPVDAESRRFKSRKSKRSGPESESGSLRLQGQNLS